jgi:hypothetical protein
MFPIPDMCAINLPAFLRSGTMPELPECSGTIRLVARDIGNCPVQLITRLDNNWLPAVM